MSEKQLRDDLLSMLVAGHETTGSALTWTLHLLAANPACMDKVGVAGSSPSSLWSCASSTCWKKRCWSSRSSFHGTEWSAST